MSAVLQVASTLEGEIRLKDGTLVVFVDPAEKPCAETECRGDHHWLDGGALRLCSDPS